MQTRGIDMLPEDEAQTSAVTGRATEPDAFFAALLVFPRPTAEKKRDSI